MNFRVFTLHPAIFSSFSSESLIARGIAENIISIDLVDWREKYGIGAYKQVDDRPFGGGTGMVLQPEPIFNALAAYNSLSYQFQKPNQEAVHSRLLPPNQDFFDTSKAKKVKKVTISVTPRGFPLTQQTAEWLAGSFSDISIVCGRYEGFDARVSECVDLELSLGNFVLNGGEVAAMAIIESVARLIPGFVTKAHSIMHDSFSSELNEYGEQKEYIIGKRSMGNHSEEPVKTRNVLFDNEMWIEKILPYIEHPQYTRPESWNNWTVPEVLTTGHHKNIQKWRKKWY